MPCWTIQTNSVELVKCDNVTLQAALKSLGVTVSYDGAFYLDGQRVRIDGGRLLGFGRPDQLSGIANQIKRAYSAEAVKQAAQRNGWTVKQTGPLAYHVVKR